MITFTAVGPVVRQNLAAAVPLNRDGYPEHQTRCCSARGGMAIVNVSDRTPPENAV
jgi:hypothetical protein